MTRLNTLMYVAAGCATALLALPPALADPTLGKTTTGAAFAMGGTSVEDLQALERHKTGFSLWVTTAARGTGAYLADVQLTIHDAKKQLVFNQPLTGPWLFIDLPVGRYEVQAAFRGQPQTRTTQIHPGDHHQLMFYFDEPAVRSPEWQSPFEGNPYGR
jgi:hypothetical protein